MWQDFLNRVNAVINYILRIVLCFMGFVSQYFMGFVAIQVVLLGSLGIFAVWSNGTHGTKYEVGLIWTGIGYLTGAGVLAFGPKLAEFAKTIKYYIDSKWNTGQGIKPLYGDEAAPEITSIPAKQPSERSERGGNEIRP